MSKKLKIALLSDAPPDDRYTGGQVLKKIIDHLPGYEWPFYWLNQSFLPSSELNIPLVFKTHYELGPAAQKLQKALMLLCLGSEKLKKQVRTLLRSLKAIQVGFRLAKKINATDADYIWLVLQGETLTLTYFTLMHFTNKPIIFHQWDPISWWSTHRGHGKTKKTILEFLVSKIEKKAFINLVPSHAWQELQISSGCRSHRIDNFFAKTDLLTKPLPRAGNDGEVHIVFVGQFYSNGELAKILENLNSQAARLGKSLILHYFGGEKPNFTLSHLEVMHHGFVSRETLINTLGQWDFALLPYPTAESHDLTSRLSFPSKSRIYLAAGLPIYAYAKLNSSPHVFYQREMPDYYFNSWGSESSFENLGKWLDRSFEATESRFKEISETLQRNFSYEAELETLKLILES